MYPFYKKTLFSRHFIFQVDDVRTNVVQEVMCMCDFDKPHVAHSLLVHF